MYLIKCIKVFNDCKSAQFPSATYRRRRLNRASHNGLFKIYLDPKEGSPDHERFQGKHLKAFILVML